MTYQNKIRAALSANPDGLTTAQLSAMTGREDCHTRDTLNGLLRNHMVKLLEGRQVNTYVVTGKGFIDAPPPTNTFDMGIMVNKAWPPTKSICV